MANIFKAKTLMGRTGIFSEEAIAPNLVYNTGNQNISGSKTFISNFNITGSGVIANVLNGATLRLSGNRVLTTADSVLTGNKIFVNNIEVQGTGIFNSVDLSNISEFQFSGTNINLIDSNVYISGAGWIYISGNPVLTGNLSSYATIASLNLTGSTLDSKINALSGTLTGGYLATGYSGWVNNTFATITNLASTGSTLDSKINALSGISVLRFGNQTISGDKTFVDRLIAGTGFFGINNLLSGLWVGIGGGCSNFASGDHSFIGGGLFNSTIACLSTIAGGRSNCTLGIASFIGGGRSNYALGSESFIGAGYMNCVASSYSNIGGGRSNCAIGNASNVGGGRQNYVTRCFSNIGGGICNLVAANYSNIGGGFNNINSGQRSFIGGGYFNCTTGNFSIIGGGERNCILANHGYIIGGRCATIQATHSGAALLGDSQNRAHLSSGEHTLAIDFASGVYFTNRPFVGGIGVLLSGEVSNSNIVYTTGNQSINDIKTFNSGIIVYDTINSIPVDLKTFKITSPNTAYPLIISGASNSMGAFDTILAGGSTTQFGSHGNLQLNAGGQCNEAFIKIKGNVNINNFGGEDILSSFSPGIGWPTGERSFIVYKSGNDNGYNQFPAIKAFEINSTGIYTRNQSKIFADAQIYISGNPVLTGITGLTELNNKINILSGLSVLRFQNQTISGDKTFVDRLIAGTGFFGINNRLTGLWVGVGGGSGNLASGDYSFIGGGRCNCATANSSTVGGGFSNCATASYSNVGGGRSNCATADSSTVGGGFSNCAAANYSFIGGGSGNSISDVFGATNVIVGGSSNAVIGCFVSIIGGTCNNINARGSNIAGGYCNQICGGYANASSIGGGACNTVYGESYCSSIVGGKGNVLFAVSNSSIGGGTNNYLNFPAVNSSIIGGSNNYISSDNSFIGGGERNCIRAPYSYIIGGRCATIQVNHSGAAVLGDGQNRAHLSSGEHTLTLDFASGVYFADPDVFGNINFKSRPTVNTTPVLLSGENADGLSVFVKNDDTAPIQKGQPVYIYGANGNNILVRRASNTGEAFSSKTLGLLNQTLAPNEQGYVITEGKLEGIDTSAGNAGDPIWLGPTGDLIFGLANKPYAPNHLVYLGVIERQQSSNGKIYVKVQNGFELQELHNVNIDHSYSLSNNQVLKYNDISGLWFNQNLSTSDLNDKNNIVYTTGDQTISGIKTFSNTGSFNTLQITNKKLSSYSYNTTNFFFGDNYLNFVNSSNKITGTLPSGIISGINYYVKNLNSGILLITGSGQRTIDGFSTVNLYKNESLQLVGVNNLGYTGWVTISADNGVS